MSSNKKGIVIGVEELEFILNEEEQKLFYDILEEVIDEILEKESESLLK